MKGRTNTKTMTQEFSDRLHKFYAPFTAKFAKDMQVDGFNWNWQPDDEQIPSIIHHNKP